MQWGRGSTLRRPSGWGTAAVVACLLAGLLLGTVRAYSGGKDIRNRSSDLSVLVGEAEGSVTALDAAAAGLQDQIDQAAATQAASPPVAEVNAKVDGLEPAAGLTAVHGPGLKVSLTDAPRDADGNYPEGVDPDDLVVHQQDVQAVVNALWAGGAEAMMIMDQRVIATSAVRCIGNTLLLQGRTYSPPFVITAIGDPVEDAERGAGRTRRRVVPALRDRLQPRVHRRTSGRRRRCPPTPAWSG